MNFKKGDRVVLDGSDRCAVVTKSLRGKVTIRFCDDKTEQTVKADTLRIDTDRKKDGTFAVGHAPQGSIMETNPCTVETCRAALMGELRPFIDNMGTIIAQIEDPADQVLAITRVMKYTMPTFTSVNFTDITPRNLTAEEEIANLNRKFNNK